jgi:hypothetical protein
MIGSSRYKDTTGAEERDFDKKGTKRPQKGACGNLLAGAEFRENGKQEDHQQHGAQIIQFRHVDEQFAIGSVQLIGLFPDARCYPNAGCTESNPNDQGRDHSETKEIKGGAETDGQGNGHISGPHPDGVRQFLQ